MRIVNLGCGSDIHRDAWNVDFRPGPGVDSVVDLSVFPWPMADESWDEVRMFDFLEHFEMSKTQRIIDECRRVLKDGGRLVIQVPDLTILAHAILADSEFPCYNCGSNLVNRECVGRCGSSHGDNCIAAIGRLYGGQDYPGNYHMAGFTKESLDFLLSISGFKDREFIEVEHQRLNWNMKISAVKGKVPLWR